MIIFSSLLGLILGFFSQDCLSEVKKTKVWIGYPQDSSDWPYRYIFYTPRMESGWVEYLLDGKWIVTGPFEDIEWDKNAARCKGPIGVPGKIIYIGFYFKIETFSKNSSIVKMCCDAFDSRSITIFFKNESY